MRAWTRARWFVQSVVTGRLYYEDGTSQRFPRRFICRSWRAVPTFRLRMWLIGKTPRWTVHRECGCLVWRGKRELTCVHHLREELTSVASDA